jgi:hypothetical protein
MKPSRDVIEALNQAIECYRAGQKDLARKYIEWALLEMFKESATHGRRHG